MVVTHAGRADHLGVPRELDKRLGGDHPAQGVVASATTVGACPSIMGAHREPPPARFVRSGRWDVDRSS